MTPAATPVTDTMIEIVGEALYIYWNDVGQRAKDAYRKKIKLALEAALQVKCFDAAEATLSTSESAKEERSCT